MITVNMNNGKFNFRVAGLIIDNERLLVHKLKSDDFWALPGGRVEFMENTEDSIIREMKEELNIVVKVERLLWIGEQFFTLYDERFHEICYYYLLVTDDANLKKDKDVFEIIEDGRIFEFKWMTSSELNDEVFYPVIIKDKINNLPVNIEKFVDVDDVVYSEWHRK